ncbi:hypothetical protein CEXT_717541 [Caerostris extrusa]|uniref:Uncharacterized protein n=1 Tax=Caerostris extrusa TaxID=172846 RepID=A0AAV4UQ71_CAEEX|nr:hypothetical protein CEXT_717541 [Caerostris extrusa]
MDPIGTERFPCSTKKLEHLGRKYEGECELIGGIELERTPNRRERSEYKQRQVSAFSTIYYGVHDQHKTLLSSLNDASEAWKSLQEQFEPKSRASVIRLLDEFSK